MITRERLEEIALTKNGKVKLYGIGKNNNVFCVGKNFSAVRNYKNKDRLNSMIDSATRLFETKEEAEFEVKYKNITRTETLKLPTWEEAQKNLEVEICAPKGGKYLLTTKIITGYSCERENPYIIRIDRIGYADSEIDFEYTKENYLKACEIARKLFLGEDKGY